MIYKDTIVRPVARYILTLSALGYDSTSTEVTAPDLRAAKRFIGKARRQWAEHNDVDYSTSALCSIDFKLSE